MLPTIAYYIFSWRITSKQVRKAGNIVLMTGGVGLLILTGNWASLALTLLGANNYFASHASAN